MEKKDLTLLPAALQNMLIHKNVNIPAIAVRGRVTNLWKEKETTNCLIQGIKGKDQLKIESNPMIRGSNGTYLSIGEYYGMKLYINITLYEQPRFEHEGIYYEIPPRVQIECYEETRRALKQKVFGNYAITKNAMIQLNEDLKGKKFNFHLIPIRVKDNALLVWLWISTGYKDRENFIYPFGGFIYAKPVQ